MTSAPLAPLSAGSTRVAFWRVAEDAVEGREGKAKSKCRCMEGVKMEEKCWYMEIMGGGERRGEDGDVGRE